ncbi:MAG: hypothetical protein WEB85_07085 [Dongiaceae bacterium]
MIDSPRLVLLPPAATGGGPTAAQFGPAAVGPTRPIRAGQDERTPADKRLVAFADRAPGHATERPGDRAPVPGVAGLTIIGRDSPLAFLAQYIAQEVLPTGLHREPWRLGEAAYRRAGGEPPLPGNAPAAISLAV